MADTELPKLTERHLHVLREARREWGYDVGYSLLQDVLDYAATIVSGESVVVKREEIEAVLDSGDYWTIAPFLRRWLTPSQQEKEK